MLFRSPNPECGALEPFTICAQVMCTVYDEGTDEYGDVTWSDDSYCRCHKCDHTGTVRDFQETLDGEAETRADLWSRVEKRFSSEDLDDHVHELVSKDASAINNAGLREQFDYLYDNAGVNWLEELLKEDSDAD